MGSEFRLTNREEGYIEGYAKACTDIIWAKTGDSPNSKSYDPMTVEGTTMHSYAFSMKDGGRHHDVKQYDSVDEITNDLLTETVDMLNGEL